MNRKIQTIITLIAVLLPFVLNASITYLSDQDYKKLNKKEREMYWQNLQSELDSMQSRKAKANKEAIQLRKDIDQLKVTLNQLDSQYKREYEALKQKLDITDEGVKSTQDRLAYYKQKLDEWEKLSDSELWNNAKAIREFSEDFDNAKESNYSKVPSLQPQFLDVERRILTLKANIKPPTKKNEAKQQQQPQNENNGSYSEDAHSVQSGESLSKIASYESVYNDVSKWGIIYRANRDQIKDPNLIFEGMELRIPRGLPTSWKVYRGESLWSIAAYPEVYGKGTKWPVIYRANKDQIKDPNVIRANQILKLPRD